MSSNQDWHWSESLQAYYKPVIQGGRPVFVLEDGRILAPPATQRPPSTPSNQQPNQPRSIPGPAQGPAASQSPEGYPRYTHSSTQGPSQSSARSQLTQGLQQRSSIDSGAGAAGSSFTQEQLVYSNVREVRDRNGTTVRLASNREGEVLLGSEGDTESLDPAYKKRSKPRSFFVFGKVFSTLWTEPSTAPGTTAAFSVVRYGQRAHSQIRRFVVVRDGGTYCIAAPILTYSGQGVAKPGLAKHEHAIIHTGPRPQLAPGESPAYPGERPILDVAIQVDPIGADENLDPMSRVNLGTTSTIQHNLKVKPCGMVRNLDTLRAAYVQVTWRDAPPSQVTWRDAPPSTNVPVPSLGRPIPQSSGARRQSVAGSPPTSGSPTAFGSMGSTGPARNPGSLPRGSAMVGSFGASVPTQQSRSSQQADIVRQQRREQRAQESSSGEEDDSDDEESDEEEEQPAPSGQYNPNQSSQGGQQGGSQQQRPPSQNPPQQRPSQGGQRRGGGRGNQSGYYRRG